jgi:hypothetical protein
MSYYFHPAAEAEHLETVAYYESKQAGLGLKPPLILSACSPEMGPRRLKMRALEQNCDTEIRMRELASHRGRAGQNS